MSLWLKIIPLTLLLLSGVRSQPPAGTAETKPSSNASSNSNDLAKKTNTAQSTNTTAVPSKPQVQCNLDLLATYGLKGNLFPSQDPMDMCGPLKGGSCCQISDQITFYDFWRGESGSIALKDKFQAFGDVYVRHIAALREMTTTAARLSDKIKTLNNCKLMAFTAAKFKVKEAEAKLQEFNTKLFAFLETSFKGFFCSICDGANQKFVDASRKTVTISLDFCWNLVNSSLPALLYFHNHFVELTNLLNSIATWCNPDGSFEFRPISSFLNIVANEQISNSLLGCKASLGTPNWFGECLPICQSFSMVNLREFFRPNLRSFQRTSIYLRQQNKRFVPPPPPPPPATSQDKKTDTGVATPPSATAQPAKDATNSAVTAPVAPVAKPEEPKPTTGKRRKLAAIKNKTKAQHKTSLKVTKFSKKNGRPQRRLQTTAPTDLDDKKNFNVLNMKYESDSEPIIPVSFDQRVHLENFVVIVEAEGFDPYKAGQTTQFTEEKFNSVLAVLKAQFKLGKLGGLVLSAPLLLTGVLLGVLQVFLCI